MSTGLSEQLNTANNGHDKNYQHPENARGATCSSTLPQLRVQNVFTAKRRRHVQAHFQPEKPEQNRTYGQVQAGECPQSSRLYTTSGLDDKNRPSSGLLSRASRSKAQMLLTPGLQQHSARDGLPALRPQFCPENFRIVNKLGGTDTEKPRHSDSCVLRRFLSCKPKPNRAAKTDRHGPRSTKIFRMEDKHGEICVYPTKISRVSGHHMGFMAKQKVSTREIGTQIGGTNSNFASQEECQTGRPAENNRSYELCQLRYSERSAELQSPASPGKCTAEVADRQSLTSYHKRHSRTRVVADKLQTYVMHSHSSSIALLNDGCERQRLGRQIRQRESDGIMAAKRTTSALQSQGDDRHPQSLTRSLSAPELQISPSSMRQPNSGCVPSKRRRNEVTRADTESYRNFSITGRMGHSSTHLSHPWKLQHTCRSSVAWEDATGVALTTKCHRHNLCEMGMPENRPVRVQGGSRGGQLLFTRQEGRTGQLLRRPQHDMEIHTSVDISSPLLNSPSTVAHEYCSRNVPVCSTKVGQSVLETRPEEPGRSTTVHDQEHPRSPNRRLDGTIPCASITNDARSVEMLWWDPFLAGWSDEQRSLLKASWRESTLKTYKPAWQRWISWSTEKGIDIYNPSGANLAQFLADLHQKVKLSLSTILVHKSVVSTFCNPNCENRLSSHTLVKQVLKSIALARPKSQKPPIWDVDDLVNYLSKKNPEPNSLYETSKCTAAILLLLSGRRVHDLTLLRISSEHYVTSEDSITLWPAFGSKTDNAQHQQSGWKLISNRDNKSLDPVHWICHLIRLSQDRRILAGSDHLFISTSGDPKPATRTIIGGWIKKLLQEAGIEATPGSFRSAVASKAWIENYPLEEILNRGNWKCANTLKKYYCREIAKSTRNSSSISSRFVPV